VRPEDVGLPAGRRRVNGLRREELASLAGVSASYYTRLEQGHGGHASASVLDAVARVLGLDDDERAHLRRLAGPAPRAVAAPGAEEVRPGLRSLVHAMGVPAAVLGRSTDMLAWNRLAHAVFAAHVPFEAPEAAATRPNWARMLFLDARSRELFVDWPGTARDLVGRLRVTASRHPRDARLAAHVDGLRAESAEFDRLWCAHPVQEAARGTARLRHPLVGELVLFDEVLRAPGADDQLLVTFHAEPGSPSEAALRRLAEISPHSTHPARTSHKARRG